MNDKLDNGEKKKTAGKTEAIKKLERENELLRLEAACLKKLIAFQEIRKLISRSIMNVTTQTQKRVLNKRSPKKLAHIRIQLYIIM